MLPIRKLWMDRMMPCSFGDGDDENAGNNNLDDEWEYINDNLTVVSHDCVKVVYLWRGCDSLYHQYLT